MTTNRHALGIGILAVSVALSACGARLSDEQRSQALAQTGRTGAALGTGGGEDVTGGTGLDGAGLEAGGAATGGPVDTGATSPGAAGGSSGAGAAGRPAGPTDTRAMPPGGNGGATDTGVTADAITIANASDISGAVPGLFEDAQLATKAYVAYFTAREGTIYGRRLNLLNLDTRLDTGANRAASLQVCNEAFAGVGSVSAFDQGGAPVIQECGVPDIRGLPTTDQMKTVPNMFGILPGGRPGVRSMGNYGWAAERFPDAVKKAAYLYIDGEVTRQLAEQDVAAAEATLGYEFIYKSAIGITETNYAPFVQQMKNAGVRYVHFVGAYQQAASIAKTMRQQSFEPDVWQPTLTAYTPDYLALAGPAAEGTYVAVAPSLLEEIDGNAELKLYAQWLNQVEPGATPTGIGQYAWAGAALFVEKAKKIGPNLTRQALLDELASVHAYDGNKLFPPSDVGGKTLSDCTQIVQVRGGTFTRVDPRQVRGHRCGDGVVDSKTGQVIKRG